MPNKVIKSETGGFNFALTAVTAILASIYYFYSYLQNTAVAPIYYVRLIGFVSVALIFLIFLLSYIFIQGYALGLQEPKDYKLKRRNERFASFIYLLAFLIFIMLSTNVLLFLIPSDWIPFLSSDPESFGRKVYYIILYIISALSSISLGWPYIRNIEETDWSKSFFNEKTKPKLEKLGLILKGFFSEKIKPKLEKLGLILMGYLFSWDKIPGSDNKRLVYFLKKKFGVDWIRKESFKKTDYNTIIYANTAYIKHFISLSFDNEKMKVNLKIGDGRTDKFIAKTENDKLNIYYYYFIIRNIFSENFRNKLAKFPLMIDNRNKNVENVKIPRNILILYFALFFLGVAVLYWFIVFIVLLNSPLLSGHVIIDMGNIYSKNDTPIPVYIKKTGPIYDSQLKLYKEYSKDNLTPIDNLSIKLLEINSSKKLSGDNSILSGNVFELGTYYIYINTTNANMTGGYYELRYSISSYEYGKSFYLK